MEAVPLRAEDLANLWVEDACTPFHIARVAELDPGPLRTGDGSPDLPGSPPSWPRGRTGCRRSAGAWPVAGSAPPAPCGWSIHGTVPSGTCGPWCYRRGRTS